MHAIIHQPKFHCIISFACGWVFACLSVLLRASSRVGGSRGGGEMTGGGRLPLKRKKGREWEGEEERERGREKGRVAKDGR